VRGDLIIVAQPSPEFFAVYSKASGEPQFELKSPRPKTEDHTLLAAGHIKPPLKKAVS